MITGRTGLLNGTSTDNLPDGNVVMCVEDSMDHHHGNSQIKYTDITPENQSFDNLFDAGDFSYCIYLSDLLDPLKDGARDPGMIYRTLEDCKRFKVPYIMVLIPDVDWEKKNTFRADRFNEVLVTIDFFQDKFGLDIMVVKCPYILNIKDPEKTAQKLINERNTGKLPWKLKEVVRFADAKNAAAFIWREIERENRDNDAIPPDIVLTCGDRQELIDNIMKYSVKEKRWKIFVRDAIELYKHNRILSGAASVVVIALGAALCELIRNLLASMVVYQVVDIRLMYIILCAALGGTFGGGFAAAIESVILFFTMNINAGVITLGFSPDHWVPFLLYFLTGTALGYEIDRLRQQIAFNQIHNKSLET
ncbi:MAG: hypothetical protein VZR00_06265 [Lachnospiraceae bacterium]|nr:hypothetical protein [Lachnospiraceae bacterium]MEE3461480.1 hypothetical protein [Lachnospiraceae bacterium]